MIKTKTNRCGQKALLWVTVFAVCATVISSFVATTVGAVSSGLGAYNNAGNAAQTQAIVNAFKKCVSAAKGTRGDTNSVFVRVENGNFGSMFDSAKTTNIATGAWLENQIQGKFQDGEIYCKQGDAKIAEMFADTLGLDLYTDIICNGASAGIMKPQYKTDSGWTDANISPGVSSCTNELERMQKGEDVSFVWNFTDGAADALVEQLYNNYVAQNPDSNLPTWDNVNDFSDPVVSYYSLMNDFMAACTDGNTMVANSNSSDYWPQMKVIDPATGKITLVQYRKKTTGTPASVTGNTKGCDNYVKAINDVASSASVVISVAEKEGIDALKEDCNQKAAANVATLRKTINIILSQSCTDCETQKDAARKKQQELDALNGQYWTQSGNSISCVEVSNNLNIPNSSGPAQKPSDVDPGASNPPNDDGGGGNAGMMDGCFQESGVLGWILCPVLRIGSEALNGVYTLVIEDFLQIDPNTIGNLRSNWDRFRNYANFIFAAAFVVVILSQITGIGISNYNIKKMLPRLIVIVVVVNASFFLCEAAVDLSNILGYGFNQFFRNLSVGSIASDEINIATFLKTTIEAIGAGAVTVAGINIAVATAGGWFPLLLPLLLSLVASLIGVFFFFVILCVRQAAIIILIVLAPVAIVCYALPNTKKAFDKWFKLFSDMLLVYPICGLLMGGSNYASRLLLSANQSAGLMFYIIAMLLPIISFFFIPAILRGSVNGIGQLGTKIQRLGGGAGRRVGGAIMHSNWAKTGFEEAQRNAMEMAHQRRAISAQRALARGGLSENRERTLRRRLARSNAVLRSLRKEDETNSYGDQHAYVDGQGNSQYETDTNLFDVDQFNSATGDMVTALKNDASVNTNEIRSLSDAHANALQAVFDNPEDRNAQIRVAALERLMMDLKSDEGATNAYDNYARFVQQSFDPSSGYSATDVSQRLGRLAKRFSEGNGGVIKKAVGKSALTTLGNIYNGNFNSYDADTIQYVDVTDNMGHVIETHYYNAEAVNGDVSKVTGRAFEDFSDGTFSVIGAAIDNGDIKDNEVQRIIEAADDFYSNPNIDKKNSAMVDNLVRKALARGAMSQGDVQNSATQGANLETTGSRAANSISAASLRSVASQISNGTLRGEEAARIASNVSLAAQDGSATHSEAWVNAANDVMAAAHAKGIQQIDSVDTNNNTVTLSGNTVADHVDAANVRFDQDYTPVQIDPNLSTASANDVHAAVEQAQDEFRHSRTEYQDLQVATEQDVQDALRKLRITNPTATAANVGFTAGDVIKKTKANNNGTSFNYAKVNNHTLAEEFRNGLKKSSNVNFKVGDVIRKETNTNGVITYNRLSDAEAADYHAKLKHNSEVKIQQERRQRKNQPQPSPTPTSTPTPTP